MYLSDEASIFHPRFLVRVEFLISWLLCAIAGTIFCVPNNCNFVSTHHLVRKYAGHRQDVRMLGSGRTGPSAFVSKVCEQRERAAADVRQMLDLDKLCCGWYSRSPTSRVMLSVVLAGDRSFVSGSKRWMAPSPSGCCLGRFIIMHHDSEIRFFSFLQITVLNLYSLVFKPTNPLRTNYKFGNEALVTRPRPFCCDLRFLPSDAYIPLDTVLQVLHLPFLCSWTILLRNNIFAFGDMPLQFFSLYMVGTHLH